MELAQPRARAVADNCATVLRDGPSREVRFDPRALFLAHYGRIRATCLDFAEPGLAVFGFSLARGAWLASMCLAARPGEVRAGVVGRHSRADLFLDGDRGLALRHLLYVIEPLPLAGALRGEVRFRVMDLETGSPPIDEQGRRVAALTAEGPVFLRCQDFALLALITGDPTDWPERAADAWDCLPERIFVEERLASGSRPRRLPVALPSDTSSSDVRRRTTVVRVVDGPTHVRAVASDEPACGVLKVESRGKRRGFSVGRETLRRGVLVGRYERCHTQDGSPILEERVSRVHLMVVELAGVTCAIDLGSSNGSFALDAAAGGPVPLRAAPLADGARVGLAGSETTLRWQPISGGGR
ncbi:MAG TPA: FHA domain-containing protein [Kofleriaceae bacterium]|nr:FHA domain-containing protein [Kofleriaceae bacterium]